MRFRSTPAAFCRVPSITPSGLATGTTAQRVALRRHALEQAAHEQRRDRLLAVLGRDQQPGDRAVRLRA